MNVHEWYREVKKHDGGMVAFCCDQLAAKDGLIEKLQDELRQSVAVKIELAASRETFQNRCVDLERQLDEANTALARQSMKIVNQRNNIDALQLALADERAAHIATKQKLEAAEKRAIDAMSRLIENWLAKEHMPKVFGVDPAKGESWTRRAYATGWGSAGKTAQAREQQAAFRPLTRIERRAEARQRRAAGIKPLPGTYGEDDLRELEIFEKVKSDTPECEQGEECSTCNTNAAKRFEELRLARAPTQTTSDWGSGSCGESAAEDEARETESLAHRIECIEKRVWGDRDMGKGPTICGELENQFRGSLDRHKRARDIADKRLSALEANVADIRKTAEADRVEFRAADAAVHERISKVINATLGEGFEMPDVPLLGRIQRIERKLFGP